MALAKVVMVTLEPQNGCDVVVIGGGVAGLSGAQVLARARRSVVVIDAGAPRNAPAEGVHGLLALDGIAPGELLERGRAEVRRYGGHVATGEVTAAARDGEGLFTVSLADGRSVRTRRLLVTTGLVDELPDVPGLRQRWGKDVLHCPYCHGWEVRDRAIGVLANGPLSVQQALLFRQWSDNVTYFAHTNPVPSAEDAEKLAARGIRVVDGEVVALEADGDRLAGVRLGGGTVVDCEVLVASSRLVARGGLLAELGLRPVEHPAGIGAYIPCAEGGRTTVPGVWVAGNVTSLVDRAAAAAAAGVSAAAQINADLVDKEIREEVAAHRKSPSAPA
ncbi:NAD(P)/FAD-dependent oxidoreductase [Streptomyces sp. H27-C3]|uniref:NAD(P)/FAD-dependent oxidoreductase n=1 Tax=Streptomyces sp. H27-C3 TaxID=3046305 RepID=UPI0024B8F1B8|nr:NAD(P)/FAD-dependent oxidoreductase [Streptomyces sp. H27-C3]MDJ0466238.1 NAD(P)/FAD-dependent oxidoreductase [Streptomyces sp. H27-C3]